MAVESEEAVLTTSSALLCCTRAKELIADLRHIDGHTLPAYNDEAVRAVLAETSVLAREIEHIVEDVGAMPQDPSMQAPMLVYHEASERNRRCLLAYHHKRCDLIDDLRWTYGSVLPADVRERLSAAELDYFKGYNEILTSYMAATGMDVMSDFQPPKDNYVEVVALRDCGRLMTMSGPRDVRAAEVHMVRKLDAEPLIRAGWLRQLDSK